MTHVIANYAVRPRQELVRLDSLEIVHSPLAEPTDYPRSAALAFYAEVLDQMLPDHDPQDATFRLLLHVLEQTRVGRIWMPVTYFAMWMVRLMGWMPETRHCTVCRRRLAKDEPAYWQPAADGLLCEEHHTPGAFTLSAASRMLAEQMFHAPPAQFAGEAWPRARAADLRRFAFQALERHGEQRLQSTVALGRLSG